MVVPRDGWREAEDISRAFGSFHVDRRYNLQSHRTGQQQSRSTNSLPSHLPEGTWLLLYHLFQVSIPSEKPYLVLFCIELSSFLPAHQEQVADDNSSMFQNVYCETDWTQGRSVSAPALQQIHIWSQFLPQSVTMGTKFISELQGVEEFTSYSLLEKKKKKTWEST